MRADVVQAQRLRVADQDAEDTAAAGQVADLAVRLGVDAGGEEALQPLAALVEHADRGVAGARHVARGLEQPLEHDLAVELGDQRAAGVEQAAEAAFIHAGASTLPSRCRRLA